MWPLGYVTGDAVPEQNAAGSEVVYAVDSPGEGDAAPESPKPLKTKAVPETVAAKGSGSLTAEETLAVGLPEVAPQEANIKSQPEAGPGVKGQPAGKTGAAGNSNLHV